MTTIHSYNINPTNIDRRNTKQQVSSKPSFGAQQPNRQEGISSKAAESLKAQRIQTPSIPHITEKDINFEVTIIGYGQVNGNTRQVDDFRIYDHLWENNYNPTILRNANGDEKYNGETTALVIRLNPYSRGIRGGDHMTMLLNGNVPTPIINELVEFMAKVGILNKTPIGKFIYYVNSEEPKQFMKNPKIKTAIAAFFRQKEQEIKQAQLAQQSQNTEQKQTKETEPKEQPHSENKSKINTTHINIANIGRKQNVNNARNVENYQRYFLENNREFTVVYDKYDKYDNNGKDIDITAILLPSKKSPMDCITITIDKKLDKQTCKNLINHLVKQNMSNIDNPNFRKTIVEYLNNL